MHVERTSNAISAYLETVEIEGGIGLTSMEKKSGLLEEKKRSSCSIRSARNGGKKVQLVYRTAYVADRCARSTESGLVASRLMQAVL